MGKTNAHGGSDDSVLVGLLNGSLRELSNENITSLYNYALMRKPLTSVDLPNVTSVGSSAFAYDGNLNYVNLPECTSLSSDVFLSAITQNAIVNIPKVTTINSWTFSTSNISFLDLPKVSAISANAFNGASKLKKLVLRNSSVVTLGNVNAFVGTVFRNGTGGTIYVPRALISSYQSDAKWGSLESTTFSAIEGSDYE